MDENKLFEMIDQTGLLKYILNNRDQKEIFSINIITYINTFMQAYVTSKGLTDQVNASIENLPDDILGRVCDKNLTISTKVINELYDRNYSYLWTIFHELTHFVDNCDLKAGEYSDHLVKELMDFLLRKFEFDNCGYSKNKLDLSKNVFDCYYSYNYADEYSEVHAECEARKCMDFFYKKYSITPGPHYYEKLKIGFEYQDSRNFVISKNFNNNYLSLEEAFDFALKYNENWLEEYPQLKEYFSKRTNNKK